MKNDRSPASASVDLGAVRRTLACTRTLLDEVERCLTQAPEDPGNGYGVLDQAREELSRLARLLTPALAPGVLQDAE